MYQSGNLAAFISALYTHDYALLGRSLNDEIIEPQRSQLIPEFDSLKEIALESGALGFSISGAGPTMFVLGKGTEEMNDILIKCHRHLKNKSIKAQVFQSKVNDKGAIRID